MIKNNNLNIIIIFLFIGIWISIGSDPYNFLFLFETDYKTKQITEDFNYKDIINLLRAIFPLFCCIICLFFLIKYRLFKKQKQFLNILLAIQIIQIFSTILSTNTIMSEYENIINHVGRYNWLISSIATILIFMIASKLKNFNLKNLFYISIFFLSCMVIWFSQKNIVDFYSSETRASLYNLDVFRDSAFFLNHQMPRVTGLSRSIIFLYVVTFFLSQNTQWKTRIYLYITLIILGSLIFLYQSKYALISYFIINIIFYFNFLDKKKGRKIIILLFISQIVLFFSLSSSRIIIDNFKSLELQSQNQELNEKKNKEDIRHFRKFENLHKKGIGLAEHIILSGRAELWLKAFDFIKHRPFLGYGSMSDRHLLNKERIDNNFLVNPVSNAFIYSFLSGGVFCLFLFLLFWWNLKKRILTLIDIKYISNNYEKIGTTIVLLIGLRCLIENSIMLFGVDYILIINSLYLTEEK